MDDEVKLYTIKDFEKISGRDYKTIWSRIKKRDIKPFKKIGDKVFYKRSDYYLIMTEFKYVHRKKTSEDIIIYEPLRIETTYHIYESKMNYL